MSKGGGKINLQLEQRLLGVIDRLRELPRSTLRHILFSSSDMVTET